MLAPLFPSGVVTLAAKPAALPGALYPEEAAAIRRAVPARVEEFRGGRSCARRALRRLGIPGGPIPTGPDRAPLWPAGVVGSLSHGAGLCGVAVGRAGSLVGLGLDIEDAAPLDAASIDAVCTEGERADLRGHALGLARGAKLAFSAKEAVYKCLYPRLRRMLEFCDVELRFRSDEQTFDIGLPGLSQAERPTGRLLGRWVRNGRCVACGVHWIAGPED